MRRTAEVTKTAWEGLQLPGLALYELNQRCNLSPRPMSWEIARFVKLTETIGLTIHASGSLRTIIRLLSQVPEGPPLKRSLLSRSLLPM